MTVHRVYAARRIVAGVYIQPSNDGERLFVITSHADGWGWGALSDAAGHRIERLAEHDPDEALSELRWLAESTGYQSKREAVEAALAS